jgi:hypothetical protein
MLQSSSGFGRNLRTRDQAALAAASATGLPIAPIYVLDDISPRRWKMGGASRWWLHGSLRALARQDGVGEQQCTGIFGSARISAPDARSALPNKGSPAPVALS